MKKNSIFTVTIASIILSSGCSGLREQEQELVGIVEDVRIANEVKTVLLGNKSGDAALGALVGGLLTGGIGGAVVGAAVGADGNQPQTRLLVEPITCKFFVNIPNEVKLEFGPEHPLQINACILLRPGDRVQIKKRERGNGGAEYVWPSNSLRQVGAILVK